MPLSVQVKVGPYKNKEVKSSKTKYFLQHFCLGFAFISRVLFEDLRMFFKELFARDSIRGWRSDDLQY